MKQTAPTNGVADVPIDIRRALLRQEIALWKNTRYLAEVRLLVQRRIAGGPDAEAQQIAEIERCERALDALNEEEQALA